MKKKIVCFILSFVMVMGLVLSQLNDNMRMVSASETKNVEDDVSSWRFSETVTEANDSAVWKAVFMAGNSASPTSGTAFDSKLTWHTTGGYYYSTSLGNAFGVVYKNCLSTGSSANAVNRRPAMEFTAPKAGNVKIALDNIGYQSVANIPVLLVYKIDAEGTCQDVMTYTGATTMQEHYYNMKAGEKLYVALQSKGSQCTVSVDPVVSYIAGEVYDAAKEMNDTNTGAWKATYNVPGNADAGDAVWYAAGSCYRASNADGSWGYIYKTGAVNTGTNAYRLPTQLFVAPKNGNVKLHFNGITSNGTFPTVTVFTRRDGVVSTVDTITAASAGKTYSLSVLQGDEIGISYANGTAVLMKCSPTVYYLASDSEEESSEQKISSWRFSETVTEANDSAVWKAVFMSGNSASPTSGTAFDSKLAWHTTGGYYYSTSLGNSFGVVYKNSLSTGSNANAVNRRPAMEFTAPLAGTVKVSLENITYQSVTNVPVLLVYKIDAEGTCQDVMTYTGATTMQEHYYSMQAGEKLYVALQSKGSQCTVSVDPVVSYVSGKVYDAAKEMNDTNTGAWKATYNVPGNTHAGDAVWYAAGGCYRASNADGTWGYIYKVGAVNTNTNPNRLPTQLFTVPKDGTVNLHLNGITSNGAFQTVTVFTRKNGTVTTVDTITATCAGKDYFLSVTEGEEIGISYANGTAVLMKCSPVITYYSNLVGDCDINGVIEIADVAVLREYLVDKIYVDEMITNVNDDDVTDVRDLVHLKVQIHESAYGVNQVSAETIPEL